jgi:hypothetical protein
MRVHRSGGPFERQLRVEVRRIRLLLERTRRMRAQVRLAIARQRSMFRGELRIWGAARPRLLPYRLILPTNRIGRR